MFERFTERARQVVVLAQDEARRLGHPHIGVEHLMLGLAREEQGIAARVLAEADLTVERLRAEVVAIAGRSEPPPTGQMPFTQEAMAALRASQQQALALGHAYIGTEHVLLGVLRDGLDGVAALVLEHAGVSGAVLADAAVAFLSTGEPKPQLLRAVRPIPEAQLAEHAVPILPSRDLQRTLDFYRRLGFESRGTPFETYRYLIVLRGTIELHFYENANVDPLSTASSCFVRVRDADHVHAEWERVGVAHDPASGSRLMPPSDTPYRMREFGLVDPDGNLLRVGSLMKG